jgi:two-component system, chemotaxis family, chemotaxis protein CheY
MPTTPKRILVAEDSPTLRNMVTNCLRRAGFTVVPAAHGKQALEIIRSDQELFDAILTDLNMSSEPSGIMLAQCVRRMDGYQYTPIIIMDTTCDEQTLASAKQAGATDCVVKDYCFVSALTTLKKHLAK